MKITFILLLLSITLSAEASPQDAVFYKCQFEMKDKSIVSGWFFLRGNEDFCSSQYNQQYCNDSGMNTIFNTRFPDKTTEDKLTIYKRLFLPRFARSYAPDSQKGYLISNFACFLPSDIININVKNILKIKYITTLKYYNPAWLEPVIVNKEILDLLKTKKRLSEYTLGDGLVSYSFFNYNSQINKDSLIKSGELYFKKIENIYADIEKYKIQLYKTNPEKAKDATWQNAISRKADLLFEKKVRMLNDLYLKSKIVVVYAFGPC